MKRIFALLLCLVMLGTLAACAAAPDPSESTESTGSTEASVPDMTLEELYEHLEAEKIYTFNGDVQYDRDDGRPRLSTDIQNNSDGQISRITIAFATWDAEGKPIPLKSSVSTDAASHVREVHFPQITIAAGETWTATKDGKTTGYITSAEHDNIHYVRACIVSCTDENGQTWENPYYDTWRKLHFGKDLTV